MAKKKKKGRKNRGGGGASMFASNLSGEIIGNLVARVIDHGVDEFLNKNGKKKVRKWLKKLSLNGTSRRSSSKRSRAGAP